MHTHAHAHTDGDADMGHPDNDDLPVGRIHTRREILALFGATGAAAITAGLLGRAAAAPIAPVAAASSCVVTPALDEGPYFVDEQLYRTDIRTDPSDGSVQPGIPLALTLYLSRIANSACTPLSGATVDIWHANAAGLYSDERVESNMGEKWLRGTQITDESGMVQFATIYPGWYRGRAVHIHAKVRTAPGSSAGYAFTTQFFFDDALSDQIYTQPPYNTRGTRDVLNRRDGIYASGGNQLLLSLTGSHTDGYASAFSIGVQTDAATAPLVLGA